MRPDLTHFTRPLRPPAVGDIGRQLRELPSEEAPPYDFAEFQRRSRERAAPKRRLVSWPHAAAAAGLTAFVAAMAVLGTRDGSGSKEETDPAIAAVAPTNEADPSPSLPGGTRVADNSATVPARASAAGALSSVPSTGSAADDGAAEPASASVADRGSASSASGGVASSNSAPPSRDASAASLNDPVERARVAREWLARHPMEPALVRAGPRLAAVSLEDRIAWFDDALTDQRLHGAAPAQLEVLQRERANLVSSLAQVRFAEALVAGGS